MEIDYNYLEKFEKLSENDQKQVLLRCMSRRRNNPADKEAIVHIETDLCKPDCHRYILLKCLSNKYVHELNLTNQIKIIFTTLEQMHTKLLIEHVDYIHLCTDKSIVLIKNKYNDTNTTISINIDEIYPGIDFKINNCIII